MTAVKTYGWLSQKQLKFISGNPEVVSLLYDLNLLPEDISARVRAYVQEERERCAKIAEDYARQKDGPADRIQTPGVKDMAIGNAAAGYEIARMIRASDPLSTLSTFGRPGPR
jgi:hypothetical protein